MVLAPRSGIPLKRARRPPADKLRPRAQTASLQVGAAAQALLTSVVLCTSLKANMGHLEVSAAAAGLSSLVLVPLLLMVVPTNPQLC